MILKFLRSRNEDISVSHNLLGPACTHNKSTMSSRRKRRKVTQFLRSLASYGVEGINLQEIVLFYYL